MLALKAWLARAGSWLKTATWILLVLAVVLAYTFARRAWQRRVIVLDRQVRVELDQLGTPDQKRKYIADQRSAINRIRGHAAAANEALADIGAVADSLQAAGHPSVAELVRRWNRD